MSADGLSRAFPFAAARSLYARVLRGLGRGLVQAGLSAYDTFGLEAGARPRGPGDDHRLREQLSLR